MLFGVVGLASADIVTYTAPAQGTVTVNANVNPKISLTIDTPDAAQTVDFGAVDPETAYTDSVDLTVKSNKVYDLTVGAPAGDVALLGFTNDARTFARITKTPVRIGRGSFVCLAIATPRPRQQPRPDSNA